MAEFVDHDQEVILDMDPNHPEVIGVRTGCNIDTVDDIQAIWGDALTAAIPQVAKMLRRLDHSGLLTIQESAILQQFQKWEFQEPSPGRPGTCLVKVAHYAILRVDVRVEEA